MNGQSASLKSRGFTLFIVLTSLCTIATVLVVWSQPRHSALTGSVVSLNEAPTTVLRDLLKHPSTVDQLWLDISRGTIVRLLAYFDARDHTHVTVRFHSIHDKRNTTKPSIYAKLYYDHDSSCLATNWTIGAFSETTHMADEYVHYLISTTGTISRNDIPLYATLSLDSNCEKESRRIYMQSLQTDQYRYNYGVCLHKAVIYRKGLQPQTLLDWVKLNIALGAEIIVIYFQTIPESFYTILEPYVKKGIVEVLDWKAETPALLRNSRDGAQTGVIAECIYYNMNRVKYLSLVDFDEFMVPEKHPSMHELLSELERKSGGKSSSFIFENANLYQGQVLPGASEAWKKCSTPGVSKAQMPIYFKRTRSCVCYDDVFKKIIVKPFAVTTSWGHCVLLYQPGYEKEYGVPKNDGLKYHYRYTLYNCCRTPMKKNFLMRQYFKNITGCNL